MFFKCSAELGMFFCFTQYFLFNQYNIGNPYSCGSCAQYYFDGRAPEGRQLMLAEYYCRKALASGELRFILLMAEILYTNGEWKNVISCIHKVSNLLNRPMGDSPINHDSEVLKLLLRARELEKLSFMQLLCQNIKYDSRSATDNDGDTDNSRQESNESLSQSSPRNSFASIGSPVSPSSPSPISSQHQPSPLHKLLIDNEKLSPIKSLFKPVEQHAISTENISSSHCSSYLNLPGWSRISSRLDGFDLNACSEFSHV